MRQIIVLNKNASKKVEHNVSKTIDLEAYLENLLEGTKLLTTPLGNIVTTNLMRGTEQTFQVLFPTEIGGSVKFLVGIENPCRAHTVNQTDPTIQKTIFHFSQENRQGHAD